jgi:hypothetical protein
VVARPGGDRWGLRSEPEAHFGLDLLGLRPDAMAARVITRRASAAVPDGVGKLSPLSLFGKASSAL